MIIGFKKSDNETSEPIFLNVSVDYINGKVYFEDNLDDELKDIDYTNLQQAILESVTPHNYNEPPKLSQEIIDKINRAKSGNYGTESFF